MRHILDLICSKKSMSKLLISTILCVVIHLWIILYVYDFTKDFNTVVSIARKKDVINQYPEDSKFILVWSKHYLISSKNIESNFTKMNCSVSQCIFTENKNLLYDVSHFDGIIFGEYDLNSKVRPRRRLQSQVYIFSSRESSYNSPACEVYNDEFFNLTITYRLDSDIIWSYFVVRNLSGGIVAPRTHVTWTTRIDPLRKELKSLISRKRKTAAWLVSHCKAESLRDDYLTELQEHLFHYSLKIDVYGKCSHRKCPNDGCGKMIRDDYYFYMAFENSFSKDYVTEKVLHGYDNYAVPIVYGGANYSRFLPPGSYINAREIHPYNLAYAMHQAIMEPALYESYFRWTNLYTIEANFKSVRPLCELCAKMHGSQKRKEKSKTKKKFRFWWNGLAGMKRCLSEAYWNESANLSME